jgi:hypothetical protein
VHASTSTIRGLQTSSSSSHPPSSAIISSTSSAHFGLLGQTIAETFQSKHCRFLYALMRTPRPPRASHGLATSSSFRFVGAALPNQDTDNDTKKPIRTKSKLRALYDSSSSLETSLADFADSSSTGDSIEETLESLQAEGRRVGLEREGWTNLAPQGARSRLVDKALTRLLRESDETKVVAYLDQWEGSLDPKCVLQLVSDQLTL